MKFLPILALAAALAFSACNKQGAGAPGVTESDMALGNPAAKVTVIEYASVGCPVCGAWQAQVWPAFKAKYIDSGKVRYVLREMLVGGGSEIAVASGGFLMARCAGKDNYFKVVDAVFAAQPGIFNTPRQSLVDIAKGVGMSEAQFNACVSDEKALAALNARVEANSKHGVSATPTFEINGKQLEPGIVPLAQLDAAIAEAEAKAK